MGVGKNMLYVLTFINNNLCDDTVSVIATEDHVDIAIEIYEDKGFSLYKMNPFEKALT